MYNGQLFDIFECLTPKNDLGTYKNKVKETSRLFRKRNLKLAFETASKIYITFQNR